MYTLGIDASTQGVKALVRDAESGAVVASATVSFGRDLPAFGCPDGFLPDPDPRIRRADPRMWLAALDLVLERLSHAFELSRIDAVGGDGQQHGSVYLNASWTAALRRVEGGAADGECLTDVFERTRWIGRFETIRVTGGASRSKGVLETIAAVFDARVETLDVTDSAALGGAVLAARAVRTQVNQP